MILKSLFKIEQSECPRSRRALAYTLMELMVATAISTVLLGGTLAFLLFGSRSASGAINQARINQDAGNAIQFIQSRVRLATSVSSDTSGNTLTLGFDTNNAVDSGHGGNGVAWGNQDYYAQFRFVGVNTTNLLNSATNQLVWIPNTTSSNQQQVLISAGVRNLPGHRIFSVTNSALATICFGVVDINSQDYYEAIEIQAMAASLNRSSANLVTILPAP